MPLRRHVCTLVLDLDDLLVHSDWSRKRGWRTFKRPGAEDFLRHMSQFYEVVVYTSQLPTYADPILDRLDPNRYIAYRCARAAVQDLGFRAAASPSGARQGGRQRGWPLQRVARAGRRAQQPPAARRTRRPVRGGF